MNYGSSGTYEPLEVEEGGVSLASPRSASWKPQKAVSWILVVFLGFVFLYAVNKEIAFITQPPVTDERLFNVLDLKHGARIHVKSLSSNQFVRVLHPTIIESDLPFYNFTRAGK